MREIVSTVGDALSLILTSIPSAIKNNLLFPPKHQSFQERIISKVKRQSSMIISQQDRLIYQVGRIQEQNRRIRELEDLVSQKDNEIKNLKRDKQSLEFPLKERASRKKR
jgi:hypothetical protein